MKVLFIAAEMAPFVKVGGLADVVGSLPLYLPEEVEVKVVIPAYKDVITKYNQSIREIGSADIPYDGGIEPYTSYSMQVGERSVELFLLRNDTYISNGGVYAQEQTSEARKQEIDRFVFFSRAAVDFVSKHNSWKPDLIHCHDWHSGLIPHLLSEHYPSPIKTVFTIHNLAEQGISDVEILQKLGHERQTSKDSLDWDARDNNIDLLLQGILGADIVTTVSPTYAQEITTKEFGEGLENVLLANKSKLYGILNGIDYEIWNPATDLFLEHRFDPQASIHEVIMDKAKNKAALYQRLELDQIPLSVPMMGVVSRLTEQKGFQLLQEKEDDLMNQKEFTLIVLGTGHDDIEQWFERISQANNYIHYINTFNEALAHQIYAAADIFLIPSKFEPCGLTQMISMAYGTIPVVHGVGGLKDTVTDGENGFVFEDFSPTDLWETMKKAFAAYAVPTTWGALVENALNSDFSWEQSAKKYVHLYKKLIR